MYHTLMKIVISAKNDIDMMYFVRQREKKTVNITLFKIVKNREQREYCEQKINAETFLPFRRSIILLKKNYFYFNKIIKSKKNTHTHNTHIYIFSYKYTNKKTHTEYEHFLK